MACKPLTLDTATRWLRVRRTDRGGDGRRAILTGRIDYSYGRPRAELIPEENSKGSLESWPIKWLEILPKGQQLRSLGGSFDPPKGYPFITKTKH